MQVMEAWTVHWLAASGSLDDYRPAITDALRIAYDALSSHIKPPQLDILVQRQGGGTIPELGISGRAHRPQLFAIGCDPGNPHFANSLTNGALTRTIIHEAHHCLRMNGPGYGRTLGEALVSEGLAGRFVRHILQSPPEPWEAALPALKSLRIGKMTLSQAGYDHAKWFFGKGALPRWLGYSLGYEIVGQWLDATEGSEPDWINVRAEIPIQIAIERGLIASN